MPATKPLAHCQDCGHGYRVPDATRTYTCKECGGSVQVDDEANTPQAGAEEPARPRRARREPAPKKRPWGMLAGLALGIGGLAAVMIFNRASTVGAAASEWSTIGQDLKEGWEDGDVDQLVAYHVPNQAGAFRAQLERVVQNRGWGEGFPKVRDVVVREVAPPAPGDPRRSQTDLILEPSGYVRLSWQFVASSESWMVFNMMQSPGDLAPRAEEFRSVFSGGTNTDLRPFFPPTDWTGHVDHVAKRQKMLGWGETLPDLGPAKLEGFEPTQSTAYLDFARSPVWSLFPMAEGKEFGLKWEFDFQADTWYGKTFRFPK